MWVAYRDYNSGRKMLLQRSSWSKSADELNKLVSKIICDGGGRDTNGAEAVEWALKFVSEEHARIEVPRILLLAAAPPHEERMGARLDSHNTVMQTDYYLETDELKDLKIPFCTVWSFEYISDQTGGISKYLDMEDENRTATLLNFVCETVVQGVGGSEHVAEYREKYGISE